MVFSKTAGDMNSDLALQAEAEKKRAAEVRAKNDAAALQKKKAEQAEVAKKNSKEARKQAYYDAQNVALANASDPEKRAGNAPPAGVELNTEKLGDGRAPGENEVCVK